MEQPSDELNNNDENSKNLKEEDSNKADQELLAGSLNCEIEVELNHPKGKSDENGI